MTDSNPTGLFTAASELPNHRDRLGYAGDINPATAFDLLTNDATAVLVDVRTVAEWNFVGLPDLSLLNKPVLMIEWQRYPDMAKTPDFTDQVADQLTKLQAPVEAPLIFICRSGARSRDAAISMTAAGRARCYNLAGGFEGDADASGHRGGTNGWKAAGLPWRQR